MHTSRIVLACLLPLGVLGVCSGKDHVDTGTGSTTTTVAMPDRPPDLTGTITKITLFEPITKDCTPPDEAEPDATVSNDGQPICTRSDNKVLATVIVEEKPLDAEGGRKISYTVTTDTKLVGGMPALAEGQVADTWVTGVCAESFPEQCTLEALHITS